MSNPLDNPMLREIIEQLDAALDEGNRVADEAAEFATRHREAATEISDEELAQAEQFARSAQAPPELRELQRQIDAGELSWEEIRSGEAFDNPAVVQGLSGGLPDVGHAYTMLREGHDVDSVVALKADAAQPEAESGRRSRAEWEISHDIDDDDADWQPRGRW